MSRTDSKASVLSSIYEGLRRLSAPMERRAFSQVSVENGLHQSAALSAMTLLITAHRAIMNTGFTLRRRGFSTDALVCLMLGLITTSWTTLVVVSGIFIGEKPCTVSVETCLARMAYAPLMTQILFFFWVFAWLLEIVYIAAKDQEAKSAPSRDEEGIVPQAMRPAWYRLLASKRFRLWNMKSSRGPLDWSGSVDWKFRWALFGTMTALVGSTTYGAMQAQLYTVGLLSLVGLVLFIVGAGGANKYTSAPHMYVGDMLRVVLETRHKEGTVYILPYRNRGFDAVWSPKIEYEHREVDEGSNLSARPGELKARKKGQVKSLDLRLAAFNAVTELTEEEVNDLAIWLYTPDSAPLEMRRITCVRAPGLHLISRSVMIALFHAEYLLFMNRHIIKPELVTLAGILRSAKGTGADIAKGVQQIGNKPGMEGYQEAVRYVYSLFNESPDTTALFPTSAPPKTSEIIATCPDNIEAYVAILWDHCVATQESTFAALYAFCSFWEFDIGNDVANGWHGFPLRARDREGDLVSWHLIWRQAWYGILIAQLTSMSPIILSAFVTGVLQ